MRRALIAGGGIAGMAAALALARAGWAVEVFEAAPEPGEVGAGLQMSPNASRVLRWLGVLDAVAACAVRPAAAEVRDGLDGERLFHLPLGAAAERRWGAPYLHVHRADLHGTLWRAAEANGARIHSATRVTGCMQRPEGPALKLEGGATRAGDLVVGADGIRSALRAQLNGPEDPVFSGRIAWRGLVPAAKLPEGLVEPRATVWAGPGRHLVTYLVRGGELVNFVAVEEQAEWTAEGWSIPGDPGRLREAFAGWHNRVTGLLRHVEETFVWGLFVRPAQVRWVEGRVVLIGDAAHPMLPFLAQGAAMALEDVAVLARSLEGAESPAPALMHYEAVRWLRVARVQRRSEEQGRLYHGRAGPLTTTLFRLAGELGERLPSLAPRALDWLYGYDATGG